MNTNGFPIITNNWIYNNSFDEKRYNLGRGLYEHGHVLQLNFNQTKTEFTATVKSYNNSCDYFIFLKIDNNKLKSYSCTCPHYDSDPKACKHIVATLFAIKRKSNNLNSVQIGEMNNEESIVREKQLDLEIQLQREIQLERKQLLENKRQHQLQLEKQRMDQERKKQQQLALEKQQKEEKERSERNWTIGLIVAIITLFLIAIIAPELFMKLVVWGIFAIIAIFVFNLFKDFFT